MNECLPTKLPFAVHTTHLNPDDEIHRHKKLNVAGRILIQIIANKQVFPEKWTKTNSSCQLILSIEAVVFKMANVYRVQLICFHLSLFVLLDTFVCRCWQNVNH